MPKYRILAITPPTLMLSSEKHQTFLYSRMKHNLFLYVINLMILSALACNGSKEETNDSVENPDSIQPIAVVKDTILFKDGFPIVIGPAGWESLYSRAFFKRFEPGKYKSIEVTDNIIILNKRDTAVFPETPAIGKKHHLRASDKETEIQLVVSRKNLTTIDYEINFNHPRKKHLKVHGTAHLHPDFFLRSDQDQSTASGATFLVTEYEDDGFKSCPVRIRLGYEEISGSALQAKIERKCNGKFGPITPDNFPSLIEQ